MISVTKFLRVLSENDDDQGDTGSGTGLSTGSDTGSGTNHLLHDTRENRDTQIPLPSQRRAIKSSKVAMNPITEEDDLKDITIEIGDVSLTAELPECSDNKRKRI